MELNTDRIVARSVPTYCEMRKPRSLFVGAERQTEREDIWTYRLNPDVIEQANLGFNLDELPDYIGIKGGAARQLLEVVIDGEANPELPRDVDLVVLRDVVDGSNYNEEQVAEVANRLASRFSPRDAENGYGAEYIGSIEDYMNEHDFTINQVLVRKSGDSWAVYATTQAVLDTSEHIIRPTIYEHDVDENYRLGNKLALKAVRLLSKMQIEGKSGVRIMGIQLPDELYGYPWSDYFMQTLQLDKALEEGIQVAQRYVDNLTELGMGPWVDSYDDPIDLYEQLAAEIDFDPSDGAQNTISEYERSRAIGGVATMGAEIEGLLCQAPHQYANDYYPTKK